MGSRRDGVHTMNVILKYFCLLCMFVNIYLALFNFSIGAAWYFVALNLIFAGLCWYSYDHS